MKRRILPVMATTLQALQGCVEDRVCAVYVDEELYQREKSRIVSILKEGGYSAADIPLKRGRIFSHDVDWRNATAADPMDIL